MNPMASIRQPRVSGIEQSRLQKVLQSEPEICRLQNVCNLEFNKFNGLRQIADCRGQIAERVCNLNNLLCTSGGYDNFPDCTNSLPPTGGEEHPGSSPPCRRGSPLAAVSEGPKDDGSLLALDLGTRTGWAVRTPEGRITSGTESFRPGRFEGGGMRYLRFRRWLENLKAAVGPIEAIYFEEVRRHVGVDAAHAYGGFLGQLTAWCEHQRIPYQGVPVGTIKKHATGRGNAAKREVIAAVQARGFQPTDDNEADAIALLLWVMAQLEVMP